MGQKEQLLEAVFGTMRSRQGTHCHVATSPRRDVGSTMQKSTILHLIIKCQTARKLGHREADDQRHGFPETEDPDLGRLPGIRTALHFVRYC